MFKPYLYQTTGPLAYRNAIAMAFVGQEGAWYDPSDLSTLCQTYNGTSGNVAVGDPVGRILDKSQGAIIGSELVTNGDFATDSDWTKGTGWSIGSGVASCDGSQVSNSNLSQSITYTAGRTYLVVFTVSGYSAGTVKPLVGGTGSGTLRSANGTYSEVIIASGGGGLFLQANSSFVGSIDNFSVKEIPGNHATQSTADSRYELDLTGGVYSLEPNGASDFATANVSAIDWSGGWEAIFSVVFPDTPASETLFTLSNALSSATDWAGVAVDSSNRPVVTTNSKTSDTGTALTAGAYVFRLQWDGTQFKLWVDGALEITETPSSGITWSGIDYLVLSAVLDATPQYSDARIPGFVIRDAVFTDSQASQVESYQYSVSGASPA